MFRDDLVLDIHKLLTLRPAGIVSDIDGTLSRIVNDPSSAVVDPEIKASLRSLTGDLDLVAVVTGRAARDARNMLELDDVVYLGNHGMERLSVGRLIVAPEALNYATAITEVLKSARAQIDIPGVDFEYKGVTASIHYRTVADPSSAREEILRVITPLAEAADLRLSHGRMVIELRPPVMINKGTALQQIVADHALRSILFLGDDVTDIDAMRALTDLRDAGAVAGLSVGVIDTDSPPEIELSADVLVNGVDGVGQLLGALAQQFHAH